MPGRRRPRPGPTTVGADTPARPNGPDPRRSTRGRGFVAVVAAAGTGLAAAVTVRELRRMRRGAAMVPGLEHDLDLAGPGPVRTVVVIGDSAAAGHGLPDPEQALARRIGRALHLRDGGAVHVRSVARDGATTADVLAAQVPATRGADVVVVGVGVNDALRRRAVVTVAEETERLLEAVRAAAGPEARVVLVTCPDLSAAPGLPALVRPVVGVRCRAVARAQGEVARRVGVPAIDLPRRDLPPEVFGDDGFHPGVLGHERLAGSVLAVL